MQTACLSDEISSGYLRDAPAGLANSAPTLRIRATGLEGGARLEPWACNSRGLDSYDSLSAT